MAFWHRVVCMVSVMVGVMPGGTFAQEARTPGKAAIWVDTSVGANDTVGALLAQAVRSKVTTSPRFRLVDQDADAGLILHLVTLDPAKTGEITIYSETYTFAGHGVQPEAFVYATVTVCGKDRVNDCAEGVLTEMSKLLDQFLEKLKRSSPAHPSRNWGAVGVQAV